MTAGLLGRHSISGTHDALRVCGARAQQPEAGGRQLPCQCWSESCYSTVLCFGYTCCYSCWDRTAVLTVVFSCCPCTAAPGAVLLSFVVAQMVSCTGCGSRSWPPCHPASSTCARHCTTSCKRCVARCRLQDMHAQCAQAVQAALTRCLLGRRVALLMAQCRLYVICCFLLMPRHERLGLPAHIRSRVARELSSHPESAACLTLCHYVACCPYRLAPLATGTTSSTRSACSASPA